MYSSIVNKSIEPCPISSSSPITTSLISNNDSIPISNNSTSSSLQTYGKKENTLTNISYSSYNCSNDYYTKKRIEELHERMDDIQISSFLKFINYHLSLKKDNEKKIFIKDLSKDLCNGHVLIDLIELFSSTKLKREHGHTRFHSLANIQYVLDYLKIRMQHIDITPYDIVSGNRKQILALLWIIMRIFDLPAFRIANKNCFVEKTLLGFGQDRSTIINWLNNILNQSLNTKEIYIKDFYIHTWDDSYYLSLIIKYLIPLSINYLTNKCFNYLKELDKLNSYDRQRFLLCLNISNYCFNTITIIDLTDKSEKCLFKYFAELKQNILNILKANHIGKLIHNNPYAKQVFDTVIQTETEHSSHVINNNEEYLSCIEDDHQQVSTEKHRRLPMDSIDDITPSLSSSNNIDESSDLRTVERSRSFYDEQQEAKLKRKNSSEKIEDLESNFHMINTHNEMPKEEQTEMITDQSEQLNGLVENLQHSVSSIEQSEQDTNSYIDAEESITSIEDSEQFPSTIEQPTIINNETKEMTLTQIENQLNEKLEQSTDDYEESQQITTSQKEIVQPIENKNSITIDDILEQPIYIIEELSHPIVLIEKSKQITTEEPKTQSITSVEENKQSTDDYEPSEQFTISQEEIEQSVENKNSITTDETLKQPILIIEELSHPAVLIEKLEEITIDKPQQQSITSNEEDTTQMTNEYEKMEHNKLDEPTNQSIIPTEENKQSTDDHEQSQQFTTSQEEIEQSVENKNPITTDETLEQPTFIITEVSQPVVLNENLEQITIEEPQQQSMSSNEEDKQMTNKYERLEQTLALIKEIEQSVKNKSSITEADQSISTNEEEEDELYLILNENIKQSNVEIEPLEQSTIAIEDKTHEQLNTSTEANNISTIEYEKLEQPISNESSSITNQRLEQLTTEQPLQSIVSNDNEDIKQFTVEPEKSNQSPVQIEQNEEFIENKINIESTPDLSSDKDFQQITPTKLDNYHIPLDENSEQHTTKQSSQDEISDEKTCIKNNSSIITNKKLEKPTVIELPQPITLNEDISKSTIENQEFIADTENLTQTIVPSQENPHCPTSDEQLTQPKILVNQPQQRTVPAEQPLLTTATIVKGPRYSDIVNRQLPKATNESAKPTDSFKKQDYSIESKKKIISPIVTIETPKQCINTADETEQVPLISTIKEPEQSEVLLEKQEPSTTIIEDAHDTSIISNGENQISSTKSNKSRRSNAKRRKSKKSSVTIENSPQNIINNNDDDDDNEEKIETSLPSQNLKSIIPEQQTSNIESEIEKSLTTLNRSSHDNTSTNHTNPQNSSALRSRKNKKKTTTTTASIEKSSSPINSTTTDNRNVFLITKECLHDRKILLFCCVFILVCFCFSIIIIARSHQ